MKISVTGGAERKLVIRYLLMVIGIKKIVERC